MRHSKMENMPVEVTTDVICDFCKASCKKDAHAYEYATLSATWSYHSSRDGESRQFDICESCYSKILEVFNVHPDAGCDLPWEV